MGRRRPLTARPGSAALLAAAVVAIGVVTLTPTADLGDPHVRWGFDRNPAHLVEDALNALLFLPLGAMLRAHSLSLAATAATAAALSITIELLQLFVIAGRFAELQDVLANGAGALVGWTVWTLASSAQRRQARRRHGHPRFRE